MSERRGRVTVFIAAEGPSEIGDLAGAVFWRDGRKVEGYFQPMLRKVLREDVVFDGQKITLLGRFDAKKRLPGHGDRAAKALALARLDEDCRVLVFAHDVDRASGRKRSAIERRDRIKHLHAEIEAGFAAVTDAQRVLRIKATPLRMLEAWALGDRSAVQAVAGKGGDASAVPKAPEETWGEEADRDSGHPKCLLRRAIGRDPTPDVFADLATASKSETLRATCPDSFAPFLEEAESVRVSLGGGEVKPSPLRGGRRGSGPLRRGHR